MATKKTAGKSTSKTNKKDKKKKQDGYFKSYLKKHKEFSKIITGCVLIYAIWFTDRVLDVMVEFKVFDSLDTLITNVGYLGIVALGAYAFRQRSKDKLDIQTMHREAVNQEQKKYGNDYRYETIDLNDENIYPNM
jgi:hypothetical protein